MFWIDLTYLRAFLKAQINEEKVLYLWTIELHNWKVK